MVAKTSGNVNPSVGTAYALLDAGLVTPRDGLLVQQGIAGNLPLRVHGEGAARTVAVRTPRARVQEIAAADDTRLAAALAGLQLGALPPVQMDGGRRWWLVELASEAHLRSAEPDWDAIAALAEASDSMGLFVYARSTDPVYYYAVRAFVGAPARFEDAASGAANATLAAWLAERDALPSSGGFYRVSQGREVGHDAIIELTVDADGEVWSGGRAATVVTGVLEWPEA
jgi:PhzF family phenazine biosynthesis protein